MSTLKLTETEKKIFDLLLSVVKDADSGTILRVAGGWVRDRLMGKESKDIDFAISNMSGEKFANIVNDWMLKQGMEARGVGIIEANPDQSKHLETATTFIFDLPIDFVNLRTETYSQESRIPTIAIGTPEEDAFRRDLTINALFYNIHTGEVEDFTGQGLQDLKDGVIRTPLDPFVTFTDDPLRILRAIRFASRYNFKLDEKLVVAAQHESICYALDRKISRERIGSELKGMFKGKNPALALEFIRDLGLREIVFRKPDGLCDWDMDQNTPHHELLIWDHLVKVVRTLSEMISDKEITDQERTNLLFAAFLHDTGKLDPAVHGEKQFEGKTVASYHGHEENSKVISEHILRDLKFGNDEIKDIISLFDPAGRAEQITRDIERGVGYSRATLGRFVRSIGDRWRQAIWLAMADDSSKKRDGLVTRKFPLYDEIVSKIETLKVDKAHEIKPIINGNEIQTLLGLKPGPLIGQLTKQLIDWQLSNPEATKEEAASFLAETHRSMNVPIVN